MKKFATQVLVCVAVALPTAWALQWGFGQLGFEDFMNGFFTGAFSLTIGAAASQAVIRAQAHQ